MARLSVLVLALVVLLVPGARAAGPRATSAAIDREMDRAGWASGAVVVDLDTGATLYAARPGVARVPASVNKLNATLAALVRFGVDGTLDTLALAAEEPDAFGRIEGDLYVRGGGDPTFATAGAAGIARRLRLAGVTEIDGAVRVDESLFDRLRGPQTYAPSSWLAPLSAIGFERPWTRDPVGAAGRALNAALAQVGILVRGAPAAGRVPESVVPLADWPSPPMQTLVALANVPSNNYVAEMLLKALGAYYGTAGTTRAGAVVARRTLGRLGVRVTMVDGSGLSRADRVSPRAVVTLLQAAAGLPEFPAFEASLPIAGRSGTLAKRMRGTAAQDACRAKTGSLIGVSGLAGYCESAAGGRVAFAFLMNGISVARARVLQDRMTAALARYDGAAPAGSAPLVGTAGSTSSD